MLSKKVVLDLILSTTKICHKSNSFKKVVFVLASMQLFACSHNESKKIDLINSESIQKNSFQLSGDPAKEYLFQDKTNEYGLDKIKAVSLYAVDINNDQFTDLVYLEELQTTPKVLIFNSVTKKFVSSGNLFSKVIRASFLNFVDLNNDGILDVIVGNLNQKSEMTQTPLSIFWGQWGTERIEYAPEANLVLPVKYVGHASVLDYNLDGKLDIFVGQWFSFEDLKKNPQILPNKLFMQDEDHSFIDKSYLLSNEQIYKDSNKLFLNAAPTIGTTICDVDKNGFPDILTNSSNGYPNKLWLNSDQTDKQLINDERMFVDFGMKTGYAMDDEGTIEQKGGGNSFTSWCLDYNNDKIIDIVVGNNFKDTDPESKDRSAVLTGSSYQFPFKYIRSDFYQTTNSKNWSEADRRIVSSDFNLDGRLDLVIDNSGFPPDTRLMFLEQNADKSYDDKADIYGINILNPSGSILIDLNKDGEMDIISAQSSTRIGSINTKIYVFENNFKRKNQKTIKLNLFGKNANSKAISGFAQLKTENAEFFQNIVYNYGAFASQNESGLYFSTGEATPQELIIHWPIKKLLTENKFIPKIVKYKLSAFFKKKNHVELNICEDGRILSLNKNCY